MVRNILKGVGILDEEAHCVLSIVGDREWNRSLDVSPCHALMAIAE